MLIVSYCKVVINIRPVKGTRDPQQQYFFYWIAVLIYGVQSLKRIISRSSGNHFESSYVAPKWVFSVEESSCSKCRFHDFTYVVQEKLVIISDMVRKYNCGSEIGNRQVSILTKYYHFHIDSMSLQSLPFYAIYAEIHDEIGVQMRRTWGNLWCSIIRPESLLHSR